MGGVFERYGLPGQRIMPNASQHKLLNMIHAKGRLLTPDEAFDFYTENVMLNNVSCKWNPYRHKGQGRHEDYELWELEQKAAQWHRFAIGSLVLQGFLNPAIERVKGEENE